MQEENYELNQQIEEMEAFLKDYGLVWVGNPKSCGSDDDRSDVDNEIDSSSHIGDIQGSSSSSPCPNRYSDKKNGIVKSHFFDCDLFVRKVHALNKIIEMEPAEVLHEDGPVRRARLVKPLEIRERIDVTLYHNGLMIKRGPFRECGSKSYASFAQDILDGYFPSEFKNEHPDGFLLNLIDRRDESYSTTDEKSNDGALSRHDLLKSIPTTIVHKGEIVSNRNEIELLLKSHSDTLPNADSKQEVQVIESKSLRDLNSSDSKLIESSEKLLLAKIQVRWLDGSKLMLKMSATDLVGDIREEIKRIKGGLDCPEFFLRSGLPSKQLSDYLSIHEAGLVPNGVVNATVDK